MGVPVGDVSGGEGAQCPSPCISMQALFYVYSEISVTDGVCLCVCVFP